LIAPQTGDPLSELPGDRFVVLLQAILLFQNEGHCSSVEDMCQQAASLSPAKSASHVAGAFAETIVLDVLPRCKVIACSPSPEYHAENGTRREVKFKKDRHIAG